MQRASSDLLAIVEAAYRVELPDADWLEGIARACAPSLDRGFGLCAFEFHRRIGAPPTILQARMVGMPDELAKIYPTVYASMDEKLRGRPFECGPCTTASQMMGQRGEFGTHPLMKRFAQTFGIYDSVWITAAEPSGWGCGLHAGRARIGWASKATVERWGRIAAHLSAAARLRRRLLHPHDSDIMKTAAQEAIFSAEGHLHHVHGEANAANAVEQLRDAVLTVEKVRNRADRQSGIALNSWKGLVAGRWTLLDRFEEGNRRYIVAWENEPRPPDLTALTARERQIVGYAALGHDNKVIAYDLGISHSTVRVLMARAASKLQVASRDDLLAAYRKHSASASAPLPLESSGDEDVPSVPQSGNGSRT